MLVRTEADAPVQVADAAALRRAIAERRLTGGLYVADHAGRWVPVAPRGRLRAVGGPRWPTREAAEGLWADCLLTIEHSAALDAGLQRLRAFVREDAAVAPRGRP